jgi:hypothetical protein
MINPETKESKETRNVPPDIIWADDIIAKDPPISVFSPSRVHDSVAKIASLESGHDNRRE